MLSIPQLCTLQIDVPIQTFSMLFLVLLQAFSRHLTCISEKRLDILRPCCRLNLSAIEFLQVHVGAQPPATLPPLEGEIDLSQQRQRMILINLHLQPLDRRLPTHNSRTLDTNLAHLTLANTIHKSTTHRNTYLPPRTLSPNNLLLSHKMHLNTTNRRPYAHHPLFIPIIEDIRLAHRPRNQRACKRIPNPCLQKRPQ